MGKGVSSVERAIPYNWKYDQIGIPNYASIPFPAFNWYSIGRLNFLCVKAKRFRNRDVIIHSCPQGGRINFQSIMQYCGSY